YLFLGPAESSWSSLPARASLVWAPGCDSLRLHSRVPTAHAREALRFVNSPAIFWDLSRVPEDGDGGSGSGLLSSPVVCTQSLVISSTMSTVSGHLLYYVRSLWSSPVVCPQSLVVSCSMSAVSAHFL
ncbi:unnamed protein product, partial [Staurois parvus]